MLELPPTIAVVVSTIDIDLAGLRHCGHYERLLVERHRVQIAWMKDFLKGTVLVAGSVARRTWWLEESRAVREDHFCGGLDEFMRDLAILLAFWLHSRVVQQ